MLKTDEVFFLMGQALGSGLGEARMTPEAVEVARRWLTDSDPKWTRYCEESNLPHDGPATRIDILIHEWERFGPELLSVVTWVGSWIAPRVPSSRVVSAELLTEGIVAGAEESDTFLCRTDPAPDPPP